MSNVVLRRDTTPQKTTWSEASWIVFYIYSRFHRSACMSVKLSLILGAGCATTLLNCAQQHILNQARNEGLAGWASLRAGESA